MEIFRQTFLATWRKSGTFRLGRTIHSLGLLGEDGRPSLTLQIFSVSLKEVIDRIYKLQLLYVILYSFYSLKLVCNNQD